MSRSKQAQHFLDGFLPEGISKDPTHDSAMRIRARAMVGVLILSVAIPFICLVAFIILYVVSDIDFTYAMAGLSIILFLLISQHVVFQSYGNLRVTALAYDLHLFIAVLIGIVVSGGWHSPAMILLAASPIVTFMTVGYTASVLNTFIAFVIAMVFFLLNIYGIPMPVDYMPEETRDYVQLMTWFMFFALLVLLLNTAEALLSEV